MIPISDDNPSIRAPYVNWTLIAICVLIYLWELAAGDDQAGPFTYAFSVIPVALFQGTEAAVEAARAVGTPSIVLEAIANAAWPPLTLITSVFLHGGFLHLAGNMLYLWIFGNNVEDAMGHGRYIVFYLACGAAAALCHAVIEPSSVIPMLGASGAISGVLAGYVLIFPRARITVIIPLGVLLYPFKIAAAFVVGFWFILQLAAAWLPYLLGNADPNRPGTAFWAHVGGFIAGLILAPLLSRLPLFGRHRAGPWG